MDAQQSLMEAGIPVFNAFIRGYKVHRLASLDGNAITQAKGKNVKEAAIDYRRVADELLREWGN